MNTPDLLQAIRLKCEQEITHDNAELASAIIELIDASGKTTTVLPREEGLARLRRDRPIVILDLEASSKEIAQARIIEIAATKIHLDGRRETIQTLVNPGFEISREIIDLTSITNEDLAPYGPFEEYGPGLFAWLDGCFVGGYNFRNYDGILLWDEFNRIGLKWNIKQHEIIDPMEIYFKMEPRNLVGAAAFYTGKDHSNAHRAQPDVDATIDILDAQLARYRGLPDDLEDLIEITKKDRRIDMAGKFVLNAEGVACFNFGKHGPQQGQDFGAPVQSQRGYLRWMLENEFPANTKMVAEYFLDRKPDSTADAGPYA